MVKPVEVEEIATASPTPVKATVCGEPLALSVIVSVPVRAPTAVGVKVTETMQLAPAATLAPQVLVCAKSPEAAIEVTANAPVPGLDRVSVWAALVVPTVADAKVRADGESIMPGVATVPVPLNGTVWGEPVALSTIVSTPVRVPAVDGVKVTEMVQLAPAATEPPQFCESAKSPEADMVVTLRAEPPVLVKVTV
jgi:hypothetical protein